jgi:hypothetical protein
MSGLPHFLDSWLKDGDEVISLVPWLPFIPHEESWYSFVLRGWVDSRATAQLAGLCQLKNVMTSLGIEPATFCDSCINVLSLLLTTTGHILVYSVHRKCCMKYITNTAMGHQILATENAVRTSRDRAGVSCTEEEGH